MTATNERLTDGGKDNSPTRLVVTIEGGVIQAMFSNNPNLKATVVDWDGLGDNNPEVCLLDEKFKAATEGMSNIDWDSIEPHDSVA